MNATLSKRLALGHHRGLNPVVYSLVVLAVVLGGIAAWQRYSQGPADLDDALHNQLDTMLPKLSLVGGLPQSGSVPQKAADFVCPQCQSSCWTLNRNRCPVCPFCGQAMVSQTTGPRISLAAAAVQPPTATAGTTAPIPVQARVAAPHPFRGACSNCHTIVRPGGERIAGTIQAGTPSPHGNRGECTTCHTVVRLTAANAVNTVGTQATPPIQAGVPSPHADRGACANCHSVVRAGRLGPVPMIQTGAVSPHAERGVCANCHRYISTKTPGQTAAATAQTEPRMLWQGVAAPPITADAVKPILIKAFGVEVCPAPGNGARITGVMGSSYAEKAGLRTDDIVLELNGAKVRDAEQLMQLVLKAPPEANAKLKILRNGRIENASVMVGEGEMEGFTPIKRP